MTEELKALREACHKAKREYYDAEHAYYKYSDGFQYHFYAMDEADDGWIILPACPVEQPANEIAVCEAYFCYHGVPFILLTDNKNLYVESSDIMVVRCDTVKLKKLVDFMESYFHNIDIDQLKRTHFYIISKNPPKVKHGNNVWCL